MSATLQVLLGSEAGRRYDFGETEILIGRDGKECLVALDDRAISRKHVRVYFQGDRYWLMDIGRNPTSLNRCTVAKNQPVALAHGDRIEICGWLLEFRCDLPIPDDRPTESSSISHSLDARFDTDAIAQTSAGDKLRVMLRISEALGRTLDTQALLAKTIDGLLEIFPQADHALVLLADGERLVSQVDRDRHDGQRRCKYSTTIVREAMATQRALLYNDLALERTAPVSDSIQSSHIRSVVCVPLLSQELQALGVIELDAHACHAGFQAEDLELLNCVARQVSLSLEYSQLHRQLVEQAQVQQELDLARAIQFAFLPRSLPVLPGYDFWPYYKATGMVGGDYYDFVRLPDGRQVVLLGDVAGKGIPAALMMARLSGIGRSALLGCPRDLCRAIAVMNREVCDVADDGGFVTLVLCAIDPARHEITVASAGHMSPIVRCGEGVAADAIDDAVHGFPLGIVADAEYKAVTRAIAPGECLTLFSDGITDAMDAQGQRYSTERLRARIAAAAADPATIGEAVLEDVQRHSAGQPQYDDMTMVVFGRMQ
jgi:serine phosphatase RsbU (regulator of sigma subunit)/pSer/pThr/pTyr-binding forkhead associated (FHA) protein